MSVQLVVYPNGYLHATVEKNFDFETSRELLIEGRKLWLAGGQELFVTLVQVAHAHACAIGTMALLAEMARKNFHLRMEQCADEVAGLFGSGLLDRYFPREILDDCQQCMVSGERARRVPCVAT